MKFVLCSPLREHHEDLQFYQPAAMGDDPGLTMHREEARVYNSQEEAAMAIPAFLQAKREARERLFKLFNWPFTSPIPILDTIQILPLSV